jgi:hypothetical protein
MQKQMYTFINTSGGGYWSNKRATVLVEYISLNYCDETDDYAELCVKFNTDTWNVKEDGLIYSDAQFMRELKAALAANGFSAAAVNDISYSEQGMQGNNYVSCDVGEEFIAAFKNNTVLANAVVKEEDFLDS